MNRTRADIRSIIEKRELFLPLAKSKVLITGATGLIGAMLAKTLLEADRIYRLEIKVIGFVRNKTKAETIFGDETDMEIITDYDNISCDYIVHTISPTTSQFFIEHPVETIRSSVETTISALELAKSSKAVMVYLSSMEQYGIPYESGQIMTEDKIGVIDHLNIRSSYSESKRMCECLCAAYASEYGLDIKIARLAQTFGAGAPMSDNRMPMQFAKAVVAGRDIELHTEGRSVSNYVYLVDALTGILTLLVKGTAGEAYNICNDKESRTVRQVADLVAGEVAKGRIGVKVAIPKNNPGYAPDVQMFLSSERLKALGWNPEISMVEAYRRLVEYVAQNNNNIHANI